jgi:hypothetical protein
MEVCAVVLKGELEIHSPCQLSVASGQLLRSEIVERFSQWFLPPGEPMAKNAT